MSNDTCCETLNDSKPYREAQCIFILGCVSITAKKRSLCCSNSKRVVKLASVRQMAVIISVTMVL
jgi:hypothetical protein